MSRNTVTSKNTLNRIEHLFTLETRVKIVPWFTSASKMISSSGRRLLPQIPTKSYGGRVISVYQSYSQQNNDSTCPNKNRALPPTNKSLKFTFTEEEYRAAKPFKDIPGPSGVKLVTNIVLHGVDTSGWTCCSCPESCRRSTATWSNFLLLWGKHPFTCVSIAMTPKWYSATKAPPRSGGI